MPRCVRCCSSLFAIVRRRCYRGCYSTSRNSSKVNDTVPLVWHVYKACTTREKTIRQISLCKQQGVIGSRNKRSAPLTSFPDPCVLNRPEQSRIVYVIHYHTGQWEPNALRGSTAPCRSLLNAPPWVSALFSLAHTTVGTFSVKKLMTIGNTISCVHTEGSPHMDHQLTRLPDGCFPCSLCRWTWRHAAALFIVESPASSMAHGRKDTNGHATATDASLAG